MTAADLKAWRQSLGLTRKTAAALLKCSPRTVEHWEQGRKIPEHWGKLMQFIAEYSSITR
jgi:DNA-binding transcriptional regulator YiaG